ncbi:MAG: hypothetical protein ACYCXQ_00795 [Candidatus Humimicrobiaceae bacterium]
MDVEEIEKELNHLKNRVDNDDDFVGTYSEEIKDYTVKVIIRNFDRAIKEIRARQDRLSSILISKFSIEEIEKALVKSLGK